MAKNKIQRIDQEIAKVREKDVYKRQLDALTDWLKEMLVGGIMSNLSGMFDSVNQQVADIATQVGPVSYTHLDVYKRQGIGREVLRRAFPRPPSPCMHPPGRP